MNSIVILGANSFLGRAFVNNLNIEVLVKAIAREIPEDIDKNAKGVAWIKIDIINTLSLIKILSKGDIVINLVYVKGNDKVSNVTLVNNIVEACIFSKVSRLIHCSTAAVVGDIQTNYVNELTLCNPMTSYEKVKMTLEEIVLNASLRGVDVGILRPTAIVGIGGKNLLKLAHSLMHGNQFGNYLKTCVLGKMPMHLVPVRNVVSALLHMALLTKQLDGNIFIVSADEDIDNNFQRVGEILTEELGLNRNIFPYIILPRVLQLFLFKIINRNDINMNRTYDSKKLSDYDFEPIDSVNEAVRQFAYSIKQDNLTDKKLLTNDS